MYRPFKNGLSVKYSRVFKKAKLYLNVFLRVMKKLTQ